MAKIGTAHVEIKPVLNEEALTEIVSRIEASIEAAVTRALLNANSEICEPSSKAHPPRPWAQQVGDAAGRSPDEVRDILNDHGHNL